MMTQLRNGVPRTPRQAAACSGPIDALLDPELFKAIGDTTRARLLGCMIKCGRPCGVGEVAECCSVDLSVVSRHLRLLERSGWLESTKKGREVRYAVRCAALCATLRRLADELESCCGVGSSQGGCCGGT